MDRLKEVKKIVAFAKRAGLKSVKVDGIEIEFDSVKPKPIVLHAEDPIGKVPFPKQQQEPTLEDINNYIYGAEEDEVINN